MKYVEEKILKDGKVINNDILKVDSFVNHQIDPKFVEEISKYFASEFKGVDRILTIETSGIAYAVETGAKMGYLPVTFAKKSKSAITGDNNFVTEIKSFTRNTISTVTVDKRFLKKGEKVLIVDDFLAEGNAALGLLDLCEQAGAKVVGVAAVIEKLFQGGRAKLENLGIKVVAGASIKEFKDNKPVF